MDADLSKGDLVNSYQCDGWVIRELRLSLGRRKPTDGADVILEWFEVVKGHETIGPVFPTLEAAEAAVLAHQVAVSTRRSVRRLEFVAGDNRGWIMREVQVDLDTKTSVTVPLMIAFYSDGPSARFSRQR